VMLYKLSDGQKPADKPPASGWQQLQEILTEQNQKLDNQSLKLDEQNQKLDEQNQAILSLNQMLQDLRNEISGITSCCNSLSVQQTRACFNFGGNGFFMSGQRVIPGDCSQPFVWKRNSTTAIPLTYTNWFTALSPPQPDCKQHPGFAPESCLQYYDR